MILPTIQGMSLTKRSVAPTNTLFLKYDELFNALILFGLIASLLKNKETLSPFLMENIFEVLKVQNGFTSTIWPLLLVSLSLQVVFELEYIFNFLKVRGRVGELHS